MKEDNIIEEKSFEFAVRTVNLYKYLTSEKQEFILSKDEYNSIITDCRTISKLLVSIIKSTKNNNK